MVRKLAVLIVAVLVILVAAVAVSQWLTLRRAHSSFENYYAFRGCVQLLSKTADSGTCKTNSGETIKIVKFNNKWYLNGDLPWACVGGLCLGI
ncbi:MAG: hypothetical protein M1484_00795 [Patescibacteria group bacterium]|nr:hypothetical protein [Patescibacteria group bacterium]